VRLINDGNQNFLTVYSRGCIVVVAGLLGGTNGRAMVVSLQDAIKVGLDSLN
jgi:hypothetical protein